MSKKLYAERDIVEQGDYYSRHTSAMTGEGLHSKSDIAAELAHRDIEIDHLQSEVERLRGRCADLESALMPFAAEAEYVPDYAVDMHLNYIMDDAEVLERASFTAEDIHTAAQRLRQQAAEIEEGGKG